MARIHVIDDEAPICLALRERLAGDAGLVRLPHSGIGPIVTDIDPLEKVYSLLAA